MQRSESAGWGGAAFGAIYYHRPCVRDKQLLIVDASGLVMMDEPGSNGIMPELLIRVDNVFHLFCFQGER